MLLLVTAGTEWKERLLHRMSIDAVSDFYVSTGFTVTAMFLLAVCQNEEPKSLFWGLLAPGLI